MKLNHKNLAFLLHFEHMLPNFINLYIYGPCITPLYKDFIWINTDLP